MPTRVGYDESMTTTTTQASAIAIAETVTIDEFTQMIEGNEPIRIFRGTRKWTRNAYNVYLFFGFPDCEPFKEPMVMYDYNKGDGHMTHTGEDLNPCVFQFANGRIVKVSK